ncbi:MAG TPA: hypothetical protein VG754_04515 [Verrucomicrobiae bacterium]|nr:hypothetical protein [Verrucomicrobiae bacterium]
MFAYIGAAIFGGYRDVHTSREVKAAVPLMLSHSLVIGYHGCDQKIVERVVSGKDDLKASQNDWDWLGHGIYFWEDSHGRALRWAKEEARQRNPKIKKPAVLGAVIDSGNCLNLADTDALALVNSAHQAYKELCAKSGVAMLKNHGSELKARFLDCVVVETLHELRRQENKEAFDTVRGFFLEGRELYSGAGFRELYHIQICVRSPKQIIGYFLPRNG